jgi:hypothetical protein
MARNVIRRSNDIHAQRLWKLFAGVFALTIFSLVFVFLQIRNIQMADEVKRLEVELAEITKRNNALTFEVEHRMTPRALHQKIREFKMQMVSVADLPKVKAPVVIYGRPYRSSYVRREEVR